MKYITFYIDSLSIAVALGRDKRTPKGVRTHYSAIMDVVRQASSQLYHGEVLYADFYKSSTIQNLFKIGQI